MVVFLQILLFVTLIIIWVQDVRDQEVWAFLFPVFAISGSFLFYLNTNFESFLWSLLFNEIIIGILLIINFLIAKIVLKKKNFSDALGLGDILYFIALGMVLPTISFINFFVFSLVFALVVSLAFRISKVRSSKTIPLAGYMAVFLIPVFLSHWLGFYPNLYSY